MSRDDDLTAAGRAGGVAGWDGGERRTGDPSVAGDERRVADRRQAQYCHVCGRTFKPTPTQKRICPHCRSSAMRMGAPTGRWGAV
ncbi:MAG: hypothetical protein VW405_07665 [Rhodospirillaceae bacterium]